MGNTSIEWTDAVWNPVTGCSKVSAGCAHCYAERLWPRLRAMGNPAYKDRNFYDVACHPERLEQPLGWKKPRRIFVNSTSDLFHDDVPEKFIAKVFAIMDLARQHTYMVLTKRPERAKELLNSEDFQFHIGWFQSQAIREFALPEPEEIGPYPFKNVWLGVSVENQATADERIPLLLQTPAVVRFISAEPLLGPINLTNLHYENVTAIDALGGLHGFPRPHAEGPKLDWVIVGGESGPGARPVHPNWVLRLRDQCQAACTKFFFKQWGEWAVMPFNSPPKGKFGCWDRCSSRFNYGEGRNESIYTGTINMHRIGKKKAGSELDGRTWDELPEVKT